MNLLGQYQNGNCNVEIYDDGTKIRKTEDNDFNPAFPESIDLKITNYCDMNCPYCHEDSNLDGKHADILDAEFVDTLKPFTEIAIGGGNPLSHPDLVNFLKLLKGKNIIANITVNQDHFVQYYNLIKYLVNNNLIRGVGVSLNNPSDEFIKLIKSFNNVVLHIINGIHSLSDIRKLYNNDLKVLILGYKKLRRGLNYSYEGNVEIKKKIFYDNIFEIINGFKVTSFDNLAIKQLDLKRIFTNEKWDEFYMGDDGQFTMYIDLVNREFAKSSTSEERYDLKEDIVDMFDVVKI